MTREETKKAIEVMQAFVDGNQIETLTLSGTYTKVPYPHWNWRNNSGGNCPVYRISENNTNIEMINLLQSALDKADFDYDTHKKLDDFFLKFVFRVAS